MSTERDGLSPQMVFTTSDFHQRLRRCDQLLSGSLEFLDHRWNAQNRTFKDTQSHSSRVHVVNTATAVLAIGRTPAIVDKDRLKSFSGMQFDKVVSFFKRALVSRPKPHWRSKDQKDWSPYTTALIVWALAELSTDADATYLLGSSLGPGFSDQVGALVDWLEGWSSQDQLDYDHTFFSFTAMEALHSLFSRKAFTDALDESYELFQDASSRVLFRFHRDFYAQLAFCHSGMRERSDATSLILSMCVLASRGQGPTELSDDVLDLGLAVAADLQGKKSGHWDTTTPLLGVASGRVGCSSVELAIHLLRTPRTSARFGTAVTCLDRLYGALDEGFSLSGTSQGLSVDIYRSGDARQTWYNCYVFEFLALYAERLRKFAAETVLTDFRYHPAPGKTKWSQLPEFMGYKRRLRDEMLNPRIGSSNRTPAVSAILFGPPGTGKTTIAHALADSLSWGMVEIGPGDFLSRGLDGIFSRGNEIFERLLLIDDVVILFDEVDELVADREQNPEMISRFLTTYMLPWVQRLHDKGTVIFLFATNHIERFDGAIKRIGRFDLVLAVGPPTGAGRLALLRKLRPNLPAARLTDISKNAPRWASIGDILRSVDQVFARDPSLPLDKAMALLSDDRLTTNQDAWLQFQADRKRFGSGS